MNQCDFTTTLPPNCAAGCHPAAFDNFEPNASYNIYNGTPFTGVSLAATTQSDENGVVHLPHGVTGNNITISKVGSTSGGQCTNASHTSMYV